MIINDAIKVKTDYLQFGNGFLVGKKVQVWSLNKIKRFFFLKKMANSGKNKTNVELTKKQTLTLKRQIVNFLKEHYF